MSLYDRIVSRPLAEGATRSPGVGYTDSFFSPVEYYGNTQWSPPVERDFVAQLLAWRQQCPDYDKPGHASYCKRCDELPFHLPTGWNKWLRKDWPIPDGGGPGAWPQP